MFKFPPPTIELTKKKSLFHKSILSPNDLFLFYFIFFGLRNNVLTIEKFFFWVKTIEKLIPWFLKNII